MFYVEVSNKAIVDQIDVTILRAEVIQNVLNRINSIHELDLLQCIYSLYVSLIYIRILYCDRAARCLLKFINFVES